MPSNREIIDCLTKLVDSILEISKISGDTPAYTYTDNRRGMGIELNEQEFVLFSKIIEDSLERQEVSERHSASNLEKILRDFLFDTMENQERYINNKTATASDFISSLSMPPLEWIVLMPMDELNSELKEFSIGNVVFSIFNKSDSKDWKILELPNDAQLKTSYERYKRIELGRVVNGVHQSIPHMDFEEYKKTKIGHREKILANFVNKICAKVRVKTVDAEKATEIGKFEVGTALSLISLYYGIREVKPIITIKEPLKVIAQSSKGVGLLKLERDWSWRDAIKLEQQEGLMNFLRAFEDILRKSPKSELDNRIIRGIRWCGRAINDVTLEDKLVEYFISLECLLSKRDEKSKGKIIGKRTGVLLTNKLEDVERIGNEVCRLYKTRNKIVHGSSYRIREEEINRIDSITRDAIVIAVKVVQENDFVEINQLLDWIDKQ